MRNTLYSTIFISTFLLASLSSSYTSTARSIRSAAGVSLMVAGGVGTGTLFWKLSNAYKTLSLLRQQLYPLTLFMRRSPSDLAEPIKKEHAMLQAKVSVCQSTIKKLLGGVVASLAGIVGGVWLYDTTPQSIPLYIKGDQQERYDICQLPQDFLQEIKISTDNAQACVFYKDGYQIVNKKGGLYKKKRYSSHLTVKEEGEGIMILWKGKPLTVKPDTPQETSKNIGEKPLLFSQHPLCTISGKEIIADGTTPYDKGNLPDNLSQKNTLKGVRYIFCENNYRYAPNKSKKAKWKKVPYPAHIKVENKYLYVALEPSAPAAE